MTISNKQSMHNRYSSYKNARCPEKFGIFWGTEGDQCVKSLEEENEEMDWRCRLGTTL